MKIFENFVEFDENDKLYKYLEKNGYGEKKGTKLILFPEEIYYLIEMGKLDEEIFKKIKNLIDKDKKFYMKYIVFSDLRKRGYFPKTGVKFGADYRIYPKGVKAGEDHSVWLIKIYYEDDSIPLIDLIGDVRLANNVRKKMIYAVVNKDAEPLYYKVDRHKP